MADKSLREQAEETLRAEQGGSDPVFSPRQTQAMLHDLRVHQIELEMQNEELRRTQEELETSKERYFDLYDLAPVGYVGLDENGVVQEANLTAAKLLGVERGALFERPLSRFILSEDQDVFYKHRQALFETGLAQVCELRVVKADGVECWMRLEAAITQGRDAVPVCRVAMSDITPRKQAEAATARLSQQQELILNSAAEGILGLDLQGNHTFVNPAAARMLGYEPEELLGRHSHSTWHHTKADGSPYPEEECDIYAACQDGTVHRSDAELFWRKDGSSFPVEYSSNPIYENGRIAGAVVTFTDITERKRAGEELAKSLRELNNLKSAVDQHAIVAITDPDGTLTYVNDRFCAISKYSREELIGQNPRILNSGDHPKEFIRDLWETIGAGQVWSGVFKNRAKDGTFFWLNTTIVPFLDATGKLYQYMTACTDITELKQMEEALRRSETRFRAVVEQAGDGFELLDEEGRYLDVNRATCQQLGYSREEILSMRISDIDPVVSWEQFAATFPALEKNPVTFETSHKHKDGRVFPVEVTASVIRLGEVRRVVSLVRDITERKRVEAALMQAKEAAESSNRAKDQFIAVLSHELRTPLTPVLATASTLETSDELPASLCGDMELIRRNVEMEAALIDDLLDATRISRGKIDLHHESVDVHASLGTAVEICRAEIEAKHLELQFEFHADRHQVWADVARLRQVFWNLLKNAVKFTPSGGRIVLSTYNEGDRLKIEVRDTGIGIEPEVLPRIFNLFEQGETGRSRQFGGLGLGLHIARAVVELHRGRLSAFSEGRNTGATFTVDLATTALPEHPPVPAPEFAPPRRALRILLVEDHPDTLRCLTRLLEKLGHTVTTSATAKTAFELLQRNELDLLISDLGLPDGSGLEIMRRAKARSGIHGIALSGFGTEEDIRQSKAAGFEEHVIKPVSIQALLEAIDRAGCPVTNPHGP